MPKTPEQGPDGTKSKDAAPGTVAHARSRCPSVPLTKECLKCRHVRGYSETTRLGLPGCAGYIDFR